MKKIIWFAVAAVVAGCSSPKSESQASLKVMRDSAAEVLSIGASAASVEERMRSRFARDGVHDFVIPGASRDAGRIEAEEGVVRPEAKSGRLVCHVGSATSPEGAMTVRLNAPADARVYVELDWGACRTCSVSTNWADGVWTVRIAKSRDAGVPDVLSVSAESPDARRGQIAYERGVRTPPTEPNYRVFIEDWRHQRWTEAEKAIAAADGSFDLVLIGDSITHGWQRLEDGYTLGDGETFAELKRGRKVLNLGYGGDRTPDVLGRIAHGELDGYTAKYISLLIGANNRPDPKEETAKGIRLILDELLRRHPESTILLTAILPQGKMDGKTPATLSPVNALIRGFADGKRVRWVDFGAEVLDAGGTVGSKYRDGVHLNEAGYRIWLAALLRAMGS